MGEGAARGAAGRPRPLGSASVLEWIQIDRPGFEITICDLKPKRPGMLCFLLMKVRGRDMNDRISVDPQVCSGKPCIRGTRIMVSNILGMIAGGYTMERVLQAYPELTREDIVAALDYASQVIDEEKVIRRA